MSLAITNQYGNVDLTRQTLTKRYMHVRGKRLQPICRRLKIRFVEAFVGFDGSKRYGYRPIKDGVVVSAVSAKRLQAAIVERDARLTPEQREQRASAADERRKHKEFLFTQRCESLGIDPSGRTARWLRNGQIDDDEAELIGRKVAYRHEHTNYDELLDSGDRDFARFAAHEIDDRPDSWGEYLKRYDFHDVVSKAIASVLESPQKAHPIWFAKAVIAVRRSKVPLETLSYEIICHAMDAWHDELKHS